MIPTIGERVHVRPSRSGLRVQRGDNLFNQFLPDEGADCIWDNFLAQRLSEGAVVVSPVVEEQHGADPV